MPRGTTLANLRLMLRAETEQTLDSTAATQANNNMNMLLANKQKWLATSFEWPFLLNTWDLAVAAQTRFLSIPTSPNTPGTTNAAINFDHEVRAEVYFNNFYRTMEYGIGAAEYNVRNPLRLQYQDPIQRWRWASNVTDTSAMQVEVWPVPVTAQTVRFTAQRVINPLFDASQSTGTNDAYTCDLDDLLLVYAVAADILAGINPALANIKAALFRERLSQLRSKYVQNGEPVIFGQQRKFNREYRRSVPLVVVAP